MSFLSRDWKLAALAGGMCLSVVVLSTGTPAAGQSSDSADFALPAPVPYHSGEEIYRRVCQACHMPAGQGAEGAAKYPAFAHNSRLQAADYPIFMVLNGHGAMPAFKGSLTDAQVAAVVGYIRTSFGNRYREPVKPAAVAEARKTAQ